MQLVLYLIPFLLLVYYLWANWAELKSKPLIPALYLSGILLWLSGIALFSSDPKFAALVRLAGIILVLAGIIIDSLHYRKKNHDPTKKKGD